MPSKAAKWATSCLRRGALAAKAVPIIRMRTSIETQCHAFDQLEWLCGPIVSIMAEMTDQTGKGFSTLALSLRFQNGAVGSLLGSYDSSYAYRDTQRIEINGTKGRVVIEDTVRRFQFQCPGDESARNGRRAISTISTGNFIAPSTGIWTRFWRRFARAKRHRFMRSGDGARYNWRWPRSSLMKVGGV